MKAANNPVPTRRTFLAGSAAAAAPLILPGRARAAISKDDPDVLRIGLVGCGGRGTGAAMQAMNAEDGTVVLTAVADVLADRQEASLKNLREALGDKAGRVQVDDEHKFLGFDAYEKLIASDVDVVLLATPPHFRPAQLAAAVGAGKHVFCEKPVAVDAPGVRSVLETAKKAKEQKTALVTGFCWRYNLPHRAIYQRILEGGVGDIRAIHSTYLANPLAQRPRQDGWSDMEWQIRNWFHFLWLGGDHIVEQAVHSLDKMAWAMGDVAPESVTCIGGRQARSGAESGNVFDHFSATYEYPGGVKGFHACRQMEGCTNENSDWVMGSKGVATIDGWANNYYIEGESEWEYEGEQYNMYQKEHDELFASIRAGTPINDGTWMANSTMLAIMGRMSAYTGQRITWEQAMASTERLGPATYRMGWVGMRPSAMPGKTRVS